MGREHAKAHGRQDLLPGLPSMQPCTSTDNSKKEEEAAEDQDLVS